MWSIRRSHQHIEPETLAEYMDDRLGAGALARADRQLASCVTCRDELESLRSAVVLLRQLPVEAPSRNFTMVAPPPELVRVRPAPLLRLPQWAFAGAASVAAIVLAVLVSADATGLLAPGERVAATALVAPALSDRAPESAAAGDRSQVADGGVASQELAAAEPSPAPLALVAEAPVADETRSEAAAAAEPSPAPFAMAAEPPMALDAQMETEQAAMPPPNAAAEAPDSMDQPAAEPKAIAPTPEARTGPLQDEERIPAAGPVSGGIPGAGPEGTGVFWRLLEGLVAVAGVLFLVGLVLKMTISRRVDRR